MTSLQTYFPLNIIYQPRGGESEVSESPEQVLCVIITRRKGDHRFHLDSSFGTIHV